MLQDAILTILLRRRTVNGRRLVALAIFIGQIVLVRRYTVVDECLS